MKTLLLLVDDAYAETLKMQLPPDKAWILEGRYDAFRCQIRTACEAYLKNPSSEAEAYSDTLKRLDAWMEAQT